MFPIEAGQIEKKDRIIPSLPGKKSEFFYIFKLFEYKRIFLHICFSVNRAAHLSFLHFGLAGRHPT